MIWKFWQKNRKPDVQPVGSEQPPVGDRALARMSLSVEALIPTYGVNVVRTQVIKSIESDLKKAARKGGPEAVEALVQNALRTPEYARLLRKLGMDEPHVRVLALQALKIRAEARSGRAS